MIFITLAVGSTNPVKINAAKQGILLAMNNPEVEITVEGFDVSSNVGNQPFGDEETLKGAEERARNAFLAYQTKHNGKSPDYSLGLEGGVRFSAPSQGTVVSTGKEEKRLECIAWMVIYNGTDYGKACTGTFQLPAAISNLVLNEGMELGEADDKVFATTNSKQKNGTVGQLTKAVIDRTIYYEHAIILAFIPFLWPELYHQVKETL
jgi:inosine/xanthosine triphosphatase